MKKVFLSLVVVLVYYQSFAQSVDDKIALKEQIRKLDAEHARAIFKSDAAALDSLMSDGIIVNHPTNQIVEEKKELMSLIKQGVIRYTAFERFPEEFLFYENMVVVMGSEIVVPALGAPQAGKKMNRRYTNIWMKNEGKWKLTIRHANNVCK